MQVFSASGKELKFWFWVGVEVESSGRGLDVFSFQLETHARRVFKDLQIIDVSAKFKGLVMLRRD